MRENLFNPLRYWSDTPDFLAALDAQDACLDREDSLSDRYAFQLGEDMGIFRMTPAEDWPSAEMERGFIYGLSRTSKTSDVYARKLLTLKRNAFARKIPVSSALTTAYLKQITVTVCPVSGVDLTQGTLADTDWSIDRLDNTLGYVPGNVCIVSTRINRLKGRTDFHTLANEAQMALAGGNPESLDRELSSGLLAIEALRMAALMAGPSGFAQGKLANYAPFAMAPSSWATIDGVVAGIHIQCARTRLEGPAYSRRVALFKRLGKDAWRASNRLVELLRSSLARGVHPADAWFDGRTISLLNQLMEEFMGNPPEFEGVDTEELAKGYRAGVSPLSQYERQAT